MEEPGIPPEPVPIPNPPDFPVTWEQSEDAQLPWQFDRMHMPDLVKALEGDIWLEVYKGANKANKVTGVPLQTEDRGFWIDFSTTSPPWTPLFATAGALVADCGGMLSHCAVVAREYGIPAVVGTGRATEAIKDGQIVEVDGDAGVVRLVS